MVETTGHIWRTEADRSGGPSRGARRLDGSGGKRLKVPGRAYRWTAPGNCRVIPPALYCQSVAIR